MTEQQKHDGTTPVPVIPWWEFLANQPPGSTCRVENAMQSMQGGGTRLIAPEIQLHCPESTCNALMFFESAGSNEYLLRGNVTLVYFTYKCRNCGQYTKIYALGVCPIDNLLCEAYKFGERPAFGPPIPARVLRLIQPDRDVFLSGRRCENQGLGIGAFTYYRRVVENQWSRLVDEIMRVGKATGAPEPMMTVLELARDEQQFSKSVKDIKDAIPPALLINGHNPLILLHGALSQGVHDLSDADCLTLATSIRAVLVELAEKLGQALKDERELSEAVTRLLQTQAAKTKKNEPKKQAGD